MKKNIIGFLSILAFLATPILGQAPKKFFINPFTGQIDYYGSSFIGLTDVPANYSGSSGKIVAVNSEADAIEFVGNVPRKTTADVTLTVGAGQTYATIEEAVATLPDYIDNNVTIVIKEGTIITADPYLEHLEGEGSLIITADGSDGHNTVSDAGTTYITSPWFGGYQDDQWNNCYLLIVDGTGIDNGFVQITDTVQNTQRAYVASWPGTQPDSTSIFIIVGALFEVNGQSDLTINHCSLAINITQCGFVSLSGACYYGICGINSRDVSATGCGFYRITDAAFYVSNATRTNCWTCAFVACNTGENSIAGAITANECAILWIGGMCYFTNNYNTGAYLTGGCYAYVSGNYGAGNGLFGVYAGSGCQVNEDFTVDYFTGTQGPLYIDDISGSWQASNSLADNAIFDTGLSAFFGELVVKDITTGVSAIYRLDGGAAPVVVSAHANFSTTKDTDEKINVYFDTTYKIQNCNTIASSVKCAYMGMK